LQHATKMPKAALLTYSKKRSNNDFHNSIFDRLIQNVSNSSLRKPKPSAPFTTDENFNLFDLDTENHDQMNIQNEPLKSSQKKAKPTAAVKQKKNAASKTRKRSSSSSDGNSQLEKDVDEGEPPVKTANVRGCRKAASSSQKSVKMELKSPTGTQDDDIFKFSSQNEKIVSEDCVGKKEPEAAPRRSPRQRKAKDLPDLDVFDYKPSPGKELLIAKVEKESKQNVKSGEKKKTLMVKSQSLNDNLKLVQPLKQPFSDKIDEFSFNGDDESDSDELNSSLVCKFKLAKASSEPSNASRSAENSPSTKKFTGLKRIFSSNIAKKATFNYGLFDWSNETEAESKANTSEETIKYDHASISKSASSVSISSSAQNSKKTKETPVDEYHVIYQTRKAYECEELGELQSINEDIVYLMDGLKSTQLAHKCLSAIKLAEYCVNSEFRMHLRSHGTVNKVLNLLKDAPSDPNVALCTSCILFALSRDKLSMDFDKNSLELMVALIRCSTELNAPFDKKLFKKNIDRCRNVCEKLESDESISQSQKARLTVNKMSSNLLALESLLSLTNRRVGDWCKDELRRMGALEIILGKVNECIGVVKSESTDASADKLVDSLTRFIRCMKLLQNVTTTNEANQDFLWSFVHENGQFSLNDLVKTSLNCFRLNLVSLKQNELSKCLEKMYCDAIKETFLLLLNLTHKNISGSNKITNDEDFVDLIFIYIKDCVHFLTQGDKFDILIMALGVLINLLNIDKSYREYFVKTIKLQSSGDTSITTLDVIIDLFNAKQVDVSKAETDQEKEWSKLSQVIDSQTAENINVTLMNSIHSAGRHMEDHIIAAHSAFIIGYVLLVNEELAGEIQSRINTNNFEQMIQILKKFLEFMKMMKVTGFSADQDIQDILAILQKLSHHSS